MNHQDFSRSLSVSTDTSQLTQDEVIKELIQEIIKNNMGENSPYIGFTENDRLFKLLKAQLLRFLDFKGKKLDSENKDEIKEVLEKNVIDNWPYYLPSQQYPNSYCRGNHFLFDFTEYPGWCKPSYGENAKFYARKCDNGENEYLIETVDWNYIQHDICRRKRINIYNESEIQISTIYEIEDPGLVWRFEINSIERDPSSIPGLYSLKYKKVLGTFGHRLRPKEEGIVYKTIDEFSLEMPEGDPSIIPDFREVLRPIIEKKIKNKKKNPNMSEQETDSLERIKKDYNKYPSIRKYAEKMYGKEVFEEERQ